MTEEQSKALQEALWKIHDDLHHLYPTNTELSETNKALRNQILVVDLTLHLADEVIKTADPDPDRLAERTANLLYAIRLISSNHPFEQAAKTLLGAKPD